MARGFSGDFVWREHLRDASAAEAELDQLGTLPLRTASPIHGNASDRNSQQNAGWVNGPRSSRFSLCGNSMPLSLTTVLPFCEGARGNTGNWKSGRSQTPQYLAPLGEQQFAAEEPQI